MSLIPGSDSITQVLSLLMYVVFIGFIFYGQKLQMYIMIREVENSLHKLRIIKEDGRKIAIDTLNEIGKPATDPSPRVDRFLDYFTIGPQGMDPQGIVYKLDHILDVRDDRLKEEVRLLAPQVANDEVQINNLENTLEAAMALNYIYKVVRHFYIQGRKTMSLYVIMQLQMILPMVMKEAEAYASALKAFAYGQPIGDSVGPLVVSKLMHGYEVRKVPKDCVVASVPFEGRTALLLKAEGPGGNVGKPGDAIETVIEEQQGKLACLIMIDAGLKLEGERVGEVSEGIGSAIGGPGVDAFKIEEKITKYKIRNYAIIIKEDIGDAVSPMRKEINDSVDTVIERIKDIVKERTKEGDTILIVGVGNSIGVGQ
ncbi:MAG: DUF1512 domain-containing protein [Nitrososphaerota archaeon]|nr:DUF1512 domain-containing protein [Nitrososphaerota archaeon]